MPVISFNNKQIQIEAGKNLLDSLTEKGFAIPNGCRSGFCQSCLMVVNKGNPCKNSQTGLKDTLKTSGHFLACQCIPSDDMDISLPEQNEFIHTATVMKNTRLATNVAGIRLKKVFDFKPGQFITIFRDNTGRSYSIASHPEDDYMELHVKNYSGGMLSPWLNSLHPGDAIRFSGPSGSCFYIPHDKKILLAGTGTGLAPLYGILMDALQQKHPAEIHLVWGGLTPDDLYFHAQLLNLEKNHTGFSYHPCVISGAGSDGKIREISVIDLAKDVVSDPQNWIYYFAGPGELVNNLKKKLFLAGASMQNIYSDPFN